MRSALVLRNMPWARPTAAILLRARPQAQTIQQLQRRSNSSASGGSKSDGSKDSSGGSSNLPIFAALALIAAGGYWYLKPVRDVASNIDGAMKSTKDAAKQATDLAKDTDAGSAMALAQQYFPAVATVVTSSGGVGGVLSSMKNVDLSKALDQLEKAGNEDVKNITKQVKQRLKDAGDKVDNMDWKGLASDLSKEYGGKYQETIDTLIGKIPTEADFDKMIDRAKKESKAQLADLEKSANKVYNEVQKARKDAKTEGDAWVKSLHASAGDDLDNLVKELSKVAQSMGVPASAAWIRSKADEGIKDAGDYAEYVREKFDMAARWLPVDQETAVKKVSQLSPSLGKIVNDMLTDEANLRKEGENAIKKGKAKAEDAVKDAKGKATDAVDKGKEKVDKAADDVKSKLK